MTQLEFDTVLVPTLEQRVAKIKFYLNQTAQNILEVGKRLIQAKALLSYGEWQNWFANNFNLTDCTAQKFMACAERFGKRQTSAVLKSSQMIEFLRLPADETEEFIEAQAAAGTPVEDMTIKNLRAEIQKFKAEREEARDAAKKAAADANEKFARYENAVRAVELDAQNAKLELQNRPVEVPARR